MNSSKRDHFARLKHAEKTEAAYLSLRYKDHLSFSPTKTFVPPPSVGAAQRSFGASHLLSEPPLVSTPLSISAFCGLSCHLRLPSISLQSLGQCILLCYVFVTLQMQHANHNNWFSLLSPMLQVIRIDLYGFLRPAALQSGFSGGTSDAKNHRLQTWRLHMDVEPNLFARYR